MVFWVRFCGKYKDFPTMCIVVGGKSVHVKIYNKKKKREQNENILNNNPPGNYFSALICLCLWIIMLFLFVSYDADIKQTNS